MPIRDMCAACVLQACDCTAIVFKRRTTVPDFAQSTPEAIPGSYCEPAAWRQVFHALRTRGADYIGGEVRRL